MTVKMMELFKMFDLHKPLMDEIVAECNKARMRTKRKLIKDPLAENQRLKDAQQKSKPIKPRHSRKITC